MNEPKNAFYILVIRKYDYSKYNNLFNLVPWTLRLIFIQLTK